MISPVILSMIKPVISSSIKNAVIEQLKEGVTEKHIDINDLLNIINNNLHLLDIDFLEVSIKENYDGKEYDTLIIKFNEEKLS